MGAAGNKKNKPKKKHEASYIKEEETSTSKDLHKHSTNK